MQPKSIKTIDLFSGVGGLSLGAARAGLNIVAAVENDPHAVFAHGLNFPNAVHISEDISKIKPSKLWNLCNIKKSEAVAIIGGPPCQGFSSIGHQDPSDPRNQLFTCFFQIVKKMQPLFFLAENVPGIMRDGNQELRETALDLVRNDYTLLPPIKVSANDFGCPTTRCRYVFFGYKSNRFNKISVDEFCGSEDEVLVKQALTGLPSRILPTWQKELQGWRKVTYPDELTEFLDSAKNNIPTNVGDKLSLEKLKKENLVSGFLGTVHSDDVRMRYHNLKPGKTDRISKSRRLEWDGFCPTLRAGTGSERGSFQAVRPIHPTIPRVITPREAARLQGFPDWFQFSPTKWHSFRQIGNSVCPILAEKILKIIIQKLR